MSNAEASCLNVEPSGISKDASPPAGGSEPRPFAAPCHALPADAPLLGYATWHAYRDAIDASIWPPLNEHGAAQQG